MEPIQAATQVGARGRGAIHQIMAFSAAHTEVLTTRARFRRTRNCRLHLSKEEDNYKTTIHS